MKKGRNNFGSQWLGIVLFILIGAVCGILFMRTVDGAYETGITQLPKIVYIILLLFFMYLAMILQIIIHEAGHLIFGLLTGYRFCSFRIFSFMWIKEHDHIRFRKMSVAGTGGQCIMAPPDMRNGRIPVFLYNYGGALINLLTSAICFVLMLLCTPYSLIYAFLMLLAVIGVSFAVINGLPLRIGPVNNDGKNAIELMKNEKVVRAFWLQMKTAEMLSEGIRMKDLPEEWFDLPADEEMENGLTATIGVLTENRLMDGHRFQDADVLAKRLLKLKEGMADLHRFMLICDRIYIRLISEYDPAGLPPGEAGQDNDLSIGEMRTREYKKLVKAMKNDLSVLRTEYAYALLHDNDQTKSERIKNQFEISARSSPYPGEIQKERELLEIAGKKDPAASS